MNWNTAELICCDNPVRLADCGIRDVVFAIGTFDGLHRGHVAVVRAMLEESRRLNAVPAVLTFHPHPRAVLTPDNPPPLLMSRERKLSILASLGVRAVVSLPFTREFASLSPDDFLSRCLLSGPVRVRGVCVGSLWRFGAKGAGDIAFLERRANELGFACRAVPEIRDEHGIVSSTKIREALAAGDVAFAAHCLGRRPAVSGVVVSGYGVAGNTLHCATANLDVRCGMLPSNGVYAAFAVVGEERFPAVVNIGVAPTFDSYGNGGQVRVEAHLLTDGAPDLYGREMALGFAARIRDERKFGSPEELAARIQEDIRLARAALNEQKQSSAKEELILS
ncbi:MAG: riboflavin biosynthesis protein RibF [Lentisphaeria bacterium]|nr:riboflavin biosynthesis protein RibF [Lentisphaeria bacterium]MBR3688640.1 riboflavin biosynthesis protein RibF [Lentisphaeria bacterium]